MKTCLIFGGKKYRVNLGGEVLTIMNEWPQWSLPQIPTVGLTYEISVDGTYAICTGLGTATDNNIRIASRYNGLPVTHIANSAFENCDSLTSITIPSSITSIGYYAFDNCNNLDNITVATNNPVFKSIDGNLYVQDESLLMLSKYATGKTDETFTFPDNVVMIGSGAFLDCDSLHSVVIPDSVIGIRANAFSNCDNLSSVVIGNSVDFVGNEAFYNCSNLTSIEIPDSVTNINKQAFENCSGLISVTLGNGLTNIENYAFKGCSSLTSIVIPDNVTSLSGSAFDGCSNLTSVVVGDGVTGIGGFQDCESLTDITIGANVTYVDDSVFTSGNSLTNIFVSDNNNTYKDINGNLYSKDGDVIVRYLTGKTDTEFTIPSSVTTVEANAFENCSKLTEIVVPDSVTTIGSGAFSGCSNLTEITLPFIGATKDDETNVRLKYIFEDVPESLNKVTITSAERIGDYAFSFCTNLTSVAIHDSVTSIGNYAFDHCSGLTEIALPDGITNISEGAFIGCSGLTEMAIPEGVTSIGNYAFDWCSSLTSITIPNSVTSIGERAFEGCSSLTEIIIPANITSIGKYVFEECSNLTNIYYLGTEASWKALNVAYLYNNVLIDNICYYAEEQPTKAGKYWHYNENGEIEIWEPYVTSEGLAYTLNEDEQSYTLTGIGECTDVAIIIPAEHEGLPVTSIVDEAFYNHDNLTSVVIPNSVTSVGSKAFFSCDGLTSIEIPDSVTSIGDGAFLRCINLASFTVGENNTAYQSIDGNLYTKDGKTLVQYAGGKAATTFTVPNSVSTLGYGAFWSCNNLTSVEIPDSITSIDSHAFYYCQSLTSITIPDSVTSIGEYAFYNCSNLTSVVIGAGITRINNWTFSYCDSLTSVYYKGTALEWSKLSKLNNSSLDSATCYYYSETQPSATPYWHYVDGVPTVWEVTIDNALDYALNNDGESYSVIGIGSCTDTEIIIPSTWNGLPVTSIGKEAFYNQDSLTSVTIGDNVTKIGTNAFRNCTNLTDVYTNNIESWLKISFSNSYAHPNYYGQLHIVNSAGKDITSLSIPNTITSISSYALAHCSSLTSVTIPSSVTSIGTYAFWRCESLTSVTIPSSVTTINDRAFAYCTSLRSINIPSSVTYVGAYAFDGCRDTSYTDYLKVYYYSAISKNWNRQWNYSTLGSKRISIAHSIY